MSRSDHDDSPRLTSPSHSRPTSRGLSIDHDHLTDTKPTNIILNVLFLGECSIIDLISGSAPQKGTLQVPRAGPMLGSDGGHSVTLEGKKFTLYALPTNEPITATALKKGIREMLYLLRRNGGVHLVVYSMNASHSTKWICDIHSAITSNLASFPRIPAVAVITGLSDVDQQQSWWLGTKDALANQGPRFDDHVFIRTMSTDVQPLTSNHVSEGHHALRALILQHAYSETGSDTKRAPIFYKQRSIANSFQSLLSVMLARKPLPHTSVGSNAIDIVLVGEIGVGKSTLVNLIARANVADVSSDTIGCTRTTSKYTTEEESRIFNLYDTPGLVDPQMGDKPFVDPIDTIQRLIHSLGNGNGPDLVLFCIDNSKPTAAFERNYRIFYKFVCSGKVPFALAVTKLRGGQDANQWWNQYGSSIRRYGMDRSRYIGLEYEKRRLDPSRDVEMRLRQSLLSFFVACTDRQKIGAMSLRSSVERFASFLRFQGSTPERTLMKQCGLEEQTARELANRIVLSKNKDT